MLMHPGIAPRIGKVRVQTTDYDWPKALAAVQKDCAVLRCEYRVYDQSFHMDLMHDSFDTIEHGKKPPHYSATLVVCEGELVRVAFEKE